MAKLALFGNAPVRKVPFPQWPQWTEQEERNILDVLRSGQWFRYLGDKVKQFEEKFAAYHDAMYGLAVTSGTAALEASLSALGVGPGDEVLVPSYTFVASATSIITNGATPVFVDIDLKTANIDLASAAAAITERTKAMMIVHFGGCPCDMDQVLQFAKSHNLKVIEDAAHAHGGKWDGKGLGSFGDIAGFSFQNSKNITAGEGGIVLTSSEELMNHVFSYHSYGQRRDYPWYSHHVVSRNLRMTEWQGAILLAQLERMPEQTELRLKNARKLDAALREMGVFTVMGSDDPRAAQRAYHLYQFRYAPGIAGVSRERFLEALRAEGIPCSAGYPVPLHKQPLFAGVKPPAGLQSYQDLELPNTATLCDENIWLVQSLLLGADADTQDIIDAIAKIVENADELR
ncbi:MAG: DegT/DnrJ/EryC1/StrS family aminotransferase [Limnochordia bacterium]|jgi:dTDP-4-amino-4,6-dideoxygalactose transaminase